MLRVTVVKDDQAEDFQGVSHWKHRPHQFMGHFTQNFTDLIWAMDDDIRRQVLALTEALDKPPINVYFDPVCAGLIMPPSHVTDREGRRLLALGNRLWHGLNSINDKVGEPSCCSRLWW